MRGRSLFQPPHCAQGTRGVTEVLLTLLLHLPSCMEALMLNLININAPIPGPETVCFFWPASAFLSALDSHKYLVLDRDFMTTLTAWDPLRAEGDISCWLLPRTVSMGMYLMWFMASLHICFSGATRRPWGTFMEGVQPLQPFSGSSRTSS